MKKLLLLAVALSLGLAAPAQVTFQKYIRVGVKAGVNASVFTRDVAPFDPHIPGYYDTFENYVRLSGFGGITLDYDITPRLAVGAELLYTARGMSYREKNYDVVIYNENGEEQAYNYYNFRIDYMELPITLGYNVLPLRLNTSLKVYGGIAKGVAVHKTTKWIYPDVDGYDAPKNEKRQLMDVRNFNTSIIAGLRVAGRKTGFNPYGDLRGSYMVNPVFSKEKASDRGNLDTRMFTLSLALGLQF
ncbi:porin family protein [Pedobacter sp. JY14-1]|uniref:porin family protein n=1 Tax=Pedobacter sp. JY14-1 TaxID=3034151 RepID=UPI0023E1A47B|nr:porin family protein [Pedobacter sp. JY14-1]